MSIPTIPKALAPESRARVTRPGSAPTADPLAAAKQLLHVLQGEVTRTLAGLTGLLRETADWLDERAAALDRIVLDVPTTTPGILHGRAILVEARRLRCRALHLRAELLGATAGKGGGR